MSIVPPLISANIGTSTDDGVRSRNNSTPGRILKQHTIRLWVKYAMGAIFPPLGAWDKCSSSLLDRARRYLGSTRVHGLKIELADRHGLLFDAESQTYYEKKITLPLPVPDSDYWGRSSRIYYSIRSLLVRQ